MSRIYFSGINGVGISPLAELAQDMGEEVVGSDMRRGEIAPELEKRGIEVFYGKQDGKFLSEQIEKGVDWFVHTSALPADSAELKVAREAGIRVSKRDEWLNEFLAKYNLKMLAVAGTHGKTTTTSMLIWAFHELGMPLNYAVGTSLPWAGRSNFAPESEYFAYEADEFDRNFLAFHPYLSAIVSVDYDHADIYPTVENYQEAFRQFESQSEIVVKDVEIDERITLPGELRRKDASIVLAAMRHLCDASDEKLIDILNRFPGAERRFEEISKHVFTDYGHHPREVAATVEMARELRDRMGLKGVAMVYEPLQNMRQYECRKDYGDVFIGIDKLFWVPTFQLREDPNLPVLTPSDLIQYMNNPEIAEAAELNDELSKKLHELRDDGWMILMEAGGATGDEWLREVFKD
jgi:UDP-N-acetylmuramate--alanine ligase